MKAHTFEGKRLALLKESNLKDEAENLREKGIIPKLVSIQVGENKGSSLYLSLKQKAAERIGTVLEIKKFLENAQEKEIIELIQELNKDEKIHGIMVQLPIPKRFSKKQNKIIKTISPKKDVDGMFIDGPFLTPTAKAATLALKDARKTLNLSGNEKVVVIGSKGFVGKRIVKALENLNYSVNGIDVDTNNRDKIKEAEIIISAIGQPGFIKGNMVKEGVVIIDIGAPSGDVDFEEVSKKAAYITPVPGGIGPMTIACLMENLVKAASQ